MKAFDFIKNHPTMIALGLLEGVALFGIACAIIAHYLASPFSWVWFLCLDCPLYAFVIWVWCKAIIPWTFNIIDIEDKQNESERKH